MTLRTTLDQLMEGVRKSPHVYEKSIEPFPELDFQKLIARFELQKRGKARGKSELPPTEPDELDEIEQELVDFVEKERVGSQSATLNQLQVYDERMASLDFEGRFSVVRSASVEAVAEFKVESLQGKDHLHSLRRSLLELENERDDFRRKHKITRTAHYPTSAMKFLKYGILALLFVIEIAINGVFLAKGNELGLLGGTVEAITFAALNIFGTALIGFFGIRWLYHRSFFVKIFGLICLFSFIAFSIGLNLSLAHYREVSGTFFEVAGTEILRRLQDNPLGLTDIRSWLFFGTGVLFSVFSVLDVISLDDKYPGYGTLDRRLAKSQADYIEWKEHLQNRLREIRDDATTALSDASRDLSIRRSESEIILEQRGALTTRFKNHITHLERVCEKLLQEYRTSNLATRSTTSPSHFKNHRYAIDQSQIDALVKPTNRLDSLDKAIDEAQATLKQQIAAIHTAFETAASEYYQLDNLVTGKVEIREASNT